MTLASVADTSAEGLSSEADAVSESDGEALGAAAVPSAEADTEDTEGAGEAPDSCTPFPVHPVRKSADMRNTAKTISRRPLNPVFVESILCGMIPI